MGDKVTLRIAAQAAPFLQKNTPHSEKLRAARGEIPLNSVDLVVLLLFLTQDGDEEIRGTAMGTLRSMGEAELLPVGENADTHPKVLDAVARLHFTKPALVALIAAHPNLDPQTGAFLLGKGVMNVPEDEANEWHDTEPASKDEVASLDGQPDDDEPVDEESEKFKSKYQLSQNMGVADKIKTALTGDKEWRTILIKDANKLVSGAVVKNPRITDAEILTISKSAVQNDEIMRVICANKEWVKNYQIRKALVENNKTPLPVALRFLASLSEKDLAALAKSKNVSSVKSTQARRILLNKKKN